MKPTLNDHLAFWRSVKRQMDAGQPVVALLRRAADEMRTCEPFAQAIAAIADDITAGSTMSGAMEAHADLFSKCVRAMVRAGEAGGVLDVICGRIAEGLESDAFPLPGEGPDESREMPVFWEAFGIMLSSGVPILEVLDVLAEDLAAGELRQAAQAIGRTIESGDGLEEAMRAFPALFPAEVCDAIAHAEKDGTLGDMARRIAGAIRNNDLPSLRPGADLGEVAETKSAPPVVKAVNLIIKKAIEDRASDIHIDPTEDGRGRIRLRVDGALHDSEPPPEGMYAALVSRLKIMAGMDIAERRLPQDGRVHLNVGERKYDLRVSVVPVVHGERVVVRILSRESVRLDLARVVRGEELETVRRLCHRSHGVVLCVGPTGSGKTTLLYSMINEVDRDRSCVMSIEDPVEYDLEGVGQIQINSRIGVTFARAMRSVMRQDPDVILLGETRNLESLQVCIQAALTGHLVMTTLHTNSAPDGLRRMIDIGLEPYLVNASVVGVIAQRLVRRLCENCRQEAAFEPSALPNAAVSFLEKHEGPLFAAKGCDRCRGTGYRGRMAIHEIILPGPGVRRAVAAGDDVAALREAALADGMKPMLINGLEKAVLGLTSVDEVLRVVPA